MHGDEAMNTPDDPGSDAPVGKTRPRASDAEVAQRVEEVLRRRLEGAEFHDLQQFAREQGWNVSERQLWRYVALADALMEKMVDADREKLFRRHIHQRRSLYARAVKDGDLRTALAIARDEAQLYGLYPAAKHVLSGEGGGPIRFSVEEAVAADRELEETERDLLRRSGGETLQDGGS
jgi:hypothetical protein